MPTSPYPLRRAHEPGRSPVPAQREPEGPDGGPRRTWQRTLRRLLDGEAPAGRRRD